MKNSVPERTVGLDLGDRWSYYVELNQEGEEISRGRLGTEQKALLEYFSQRKGCRVALEAGTHSGWVSRLLEELGCEVYVANPRQIPLITENQRKSDHLDAETLARLARFDPELLKPIRHRSLDYQQDLMKLRVRDQLVKTRTGLTNAVRGNLKQFGLRIKKCRPESFVKHAQAVIPEELKSGLQGMLVTIQCLNDRIGEANEEIEELCREKYPETELLLQIRGVGPLTALAFVLCLESPDYFATNRSVGAYLGLVPKRKQSGESDPPQRISRAGNELMRRLLIQCGHYIIGHYGKDCDLRRHGKKIEARGGKVAKKKAAVAVARKLSVLMLCLWRTSQVYEPLYNASRQQQVA